MSQGRETTRIVTIASAATVRVWDDPTSTPIRDLEIFVSTEGTVPITGDIDFDVYLGGHWAAGAPYADGSTHAGGIVQGTTTTITGATEVAHNIYIGTFMLPSNRKVPVSSTITKGIGGVPWVLEITNDKAVPLRLIVTFISRTVSDPV
jgi:hypothetical protein